MRYYRSIRRVLWKPQIFFGNLSIDLPPKKTQDKIAALLGALDEKIALNKKINATLEAMSKTLYMHEFFRKPPNGKLGDVLIENLKSTISVGVAKDFGGELFLITFGRTADSHTCAIGSCPC